jgi:8-oxo-dGTP pyrophosphatase MutT (NUDIX family)
MKEAVTLLLLDSYDGVEWRDPKVLAVKRLKSNGKLGLPGGKVNSGETLKEAIIREVKEECNLSIPKEALVKVYACIVSGFYCTTFAIKKEYLDTIKKRRVKQMEEDIVPIWVKFNGYDFVSRSEFSDYNHGLLRNLDEIVKVLK